MGLFDKIKKKPENETKAVRPGLDRDYKKSLLENDESVLAIPVPPYSLVAVLSAWEKDWKIISSLSGSIPIPVSDISNLRVA